MRNNLNSVLLEGILISNPVIDQEKGLYGFTIKSIKSVKVGNENQEEISFFNVITGLEPIKPLKAHLKAGCIVRVVGRLKQNEEQLVYIVADHMELSQIK
jgi:single-stranded DNA-binding protein